VGCRVREAARPETQVADGHTNEVSRVDDPSEVERTYPRQARTPFNVTACFE
jgi:hypothetical protein